MAANSPQPPEGMREQLTWEPAAFVTTWGWGAAIKKQIQKCQGRLLVKYPYVSAEWWELQVSIKELKGISRPLPSESAARATTDPAQRRSFPGRDSSRGCDPTFVSPLRTSPPRAEGDEATPLLLRPVPPGLGRAPAGAAAAGRRGQHVWRPLTALSAGARLSTAAAVPHGPAAAPHGPSAPTPAPSDPPSAAPGREARRPRGGRRRPRLPPPSGAVVAPRSPQGGSPPPAPPPHRPPPPAQLPPPPPAAAPAPVPAPAPPLQRRRPGSQEAERGGHNVCARRGGDCTSSSGTGGAPELPAPPPLSLSAPRFVRPAAAAARGRERLCPGSGWPPWSRSRRCGTARLGGRGRGWAQTGRCEAHRSSGWITSLSAASLHFPFVLMPRNLSCRNLSSQSTEYFHCVCEATQWKLALSHC